MAKAWREVIASPQYQALTPEQQAAAQEQYFNEVVAPKAGNRAEEARQAFCAAYPAPVSQPANRSQQSGQEQGSMLSELGNAAEQAGRGLINIPFDVLQGGASLINAISQGLGGRKFLMMCIARWIAPQTLMHRLGKQSGGVFSRLVLLQKSLYLAVRKNLPVI